jgi:hypothetical protein
MPATETRPVRRFTIQPQRPQPVPFNWTRLYILKEPNVQPTISTIKTETVIPTVQRTIVEDTRLQNVAVVEPGPSSQNVVVVHQAKPPHDLNVEFVIPEETPSKQTVTIIDERVERLRREHKQRMAEWNTRPQSLAGRE